MASPARWLALVSYVLVLLLITGLGLWALQVQRAPLPREQIAGIADLARSALKDQAEIRVSWATEAFRPGEAQEFVASFSVALAAQGIATRAVEVPPPEPELATLRPCLRHSLVAEGVTAQECVEALEAAELQNSPEAALDGALQLHVVLAADCSTLLLGTGLTAVLRWNHQGEASELAQATAAELARTWLRPMTFESTATLFEVAPSYSLSFHLVGDCRRRVAWDFQGDVFSSYLQPLIERLALLFDFEVDAQVVQCGALGDIKGQRKSPTGAVVVDATALQDGFLRRAGDWPGDAVTRDAPWLHPLVHLVAFTSSLPISVVDEERQEHTSFAVPGWGAVALTGAGDGHCDGGAQDAAARAQGASAAPRAVEALGPCQAMHVASAWASHLRSWLLLRPDGPIGEASAELGERLQCHSATRSQLPVVAATPRVGGIAAWELRSIGRGVYARYLNRTAEVLADLLAIVDAQPDLMVLPELGQRATEAAARSHAGAAMLSAGSLSLALAASRRALKLALAASHDDTVAGHLYFSAEFRYAVYLPLALPVYLPVLISCIRHVKQAKKRRAARLTATANAAGVAAASLATAATAEGSPAGATPLS